MTVYIIRGISGSGKSTLAGQIKSGLKDKGEKAIIVNRDKIRAYLFGSEADFGVDEDYVTYIEHRTEDEAIRRGYHLIVDNTHIYSNYVDQLIGLAEAYGVDYEVRVVDVGLETALARNRERGRIGGREVPEEVIRKQHAAFEKTKDFYVNVQS